MIAIVLRSRGIRATALRAAMRVHPLAQIITLADLADLPRHTQLSRCLVIHDFEPDPESSLVLLRRRQAAGHGVSVLALITPPATPVLDLLLAASDLALSGVVIAGEEEPDRMAERIAVALDRSARGRLLQLVLTAWRLDSVLTRVARCELSGDRSHTTLEGLLRESGVSRRRFTEAAARRGVAPPLRFLQGLRVLEAVELLQEGCTVRRTAERLGYGSQDTLRQHFRMLAGVTPRVARSRRLEEVAAAVGREAGLLPGRAEAARAPAAD